MGRLCMHLREEHQHASASTDTNPAPGFCRVAGSSGAARHPGCASTSATTTSDAATRLARIGSTASPYTPSRAAHTVPSQSRGARPRDPGWPGRCHSGQCAWWRASTAPGIAARYQTSSRNGKSPDSATASCLTSHSHASESARGRRVLSRGATTQRRWDAVA